MRRLILLYPLLAMLVAIAWGPGRDAALAIRLAAALGSLAAGSTGQEYPVDVSRMVQAGPGGDLVAQVYCARGSFPRRSVVLAAGVSELGIYHPRLVALSRSLAHNGFLVVTPDIRRFREFRLAAEAMDEIAFWFDQVGRLPAGMRVEKAGLAGISFSGTLALITAARPALRDRVAFVLAIGAYDDPFRCSRFWFAAGPVTVGPGYYPTRYYARWIQMLAALELLPVREERFFLEKMLTGLLLQRPLEVAPAALSAETKRWVRLATMREDESDPELARRIDEHLTPVLYNKVLPDRAAAELRCPVFLVHGAYDDLIPADESALLRDRVKGARAYLLVTPFITHTHPFQKPLSRLERAGAVADFLLFFYRFARKVR